MRCQEGEEDDPPLVPRLGTRTSSTLLFSTTTRFCDMKQKRNYSFLTSRSIAKTSYTIRSSGVLLQTGRVFLMTFIVGVKSYMTKLPIKVRGVYRFSVADPGSGRGHNGRRGYRLGRVVGGAAPGRVREGGTPPAQLGGIGERCKLSRWGLGRSPRSFAFRHKKSVACAVVCRADLVCLVFDYYSAASIGRHHVDVIHVACF